MKTLLRTFLYPMLAALCAVQPAAADPLVTDGTFTNVFVTATSSTAGTLYGQFGTDSTTAPVTPAKGSTLSVGGWSTGGYNFVFLPGTVDGGTSTAPNTGVAAETGGQYKNTYLWGNNNKGTNTDTDAITAPSCGGNYIAADGAFETGAISQTITGLVIGQIYEVNFTWAAGQQQSYAGATTEQWNVMLGGASLSTPIFDLASHGFSGWMASQTSTGGNFDYTATATSEVLSFVAAGTPSGEPPFLMLAGVSMTSVPEPSEWLLLMGIGSIFTFLCILRRRRSNALAVPEGGPVTQEARVSFHKDNFRTAPLVTRKSSMLDPAGDTPTG